MGRFSHDMARWMWHGLAAALFAFSPAEIIADLDALSKIVEVLAWKCWGKPPSRRY